MTRRLFCVMLFCVMLLCGMPILVDGTENVCYDIGRPKHNQKEA